MTHRNDPLKVEPPKALPYNARMDKQLLINCVIAQLKDMLEHAQQAAEEAHKGATHDQSKAETQYDTLGLEHAYLAEGQAKRIKELKSQVTHFNQFPIKAFSEDDPIYLGALVSLVNTHNQQTLMVFLAPCAGGEQVEMDGKTVQLISPNSPLTQGLLGLYAGDECKLESGQVFEIITIE